jgi:hypothetical protein
MPLTIARRPDGGAIRRPSKLRQAAGSHRNAAAAWCPGYSLARTLRLSPSRIGDIVLERRGVTADTALPPSPCCRIARATYVAMSQTPFRLVSNTYCQSSIDFLCCYAAYIRS